MFARKAWILSSLTGSSVPVRALFRISPLLLSIPMHQQSIQNSSQRLALLGLSCLGVAMSLLYFLMTQDQSKPTRSRHSLKGLPAEPKPKPRSRFRLPSLKTVQGYFARGWALALVVVGEGLTLIGFAELPPLLPFLNLILSMSLLCVVSYGLVYTLLPVLRWKALGSVMGVMGAGGSAGAALTSILFGGVLHWSTVWLLLGIGISFIACFVLLKRSERFA